MSSSSSVSNDAERYKGFAGSIERLSIFSPETAEYEEAVNRLLTDGQTPKAILAALDLASADQVNGARLVAELAKSESARETLLSMGVIPALLSLMSRSDNALSLQCVRALGNMCYERDDCRQQIVDGGGAEKLVLLMNRSLEAQPELLPLKTACCGFLHNLTNDYEVAQKAVISSGVMSALKPLLDSHQDVPAICNFCYLALGSLAETEMGRAEAVRTGLIDSLIRAFVNTSLTEMDDILLRLLSSFTSESDEVKTKLAESSADMRLLSIISLLGNSAEPDDQQLVTTASELLVLVLTGDEAMYIWFDGGIGLTFTSVCEWLSSENTQLVQSAAYSLGNFARCEENGSIMIQRGINVELCKCLDRYQALMNNKEKVTVIHALLSALRNLAIASANKTHLIEQGICNHLLPYMSAQSSIITSKLAGIFRLLIDKQEQQASILGQDKVFVDHAIKWGYDTTNLLLKGESTRLLAWLVKNSCRVEVCSNLLLQGALPHLVYLVSSDHAVMQNEGLVSVILMASKLPEESKQALQECGILDAVQDLLTKEEPPISEVLQNVFMLITQMVANGMKEYVTESKVVKLLDDILMKDSSKNDAAAQALALRLRSTLTM